MDQDQFQSFIQALWAALPKQSKMPKLSLGSDVDMVKVKIESWEQYCEYNLMDDTRRFSIDLRQMCPVGAQYDRLL